MHRTIEKWHKTEQIFSNLVDQPKELAAWKIITRRSEAIIGEKSKPPMRGMNLRIGARIGSVMSFVIVTSGLEGSMEIQEKAIRKTRASRRMPARIWTKREIASMSAS